MPWWGAVGLGAAEFHDREHRGDGAVELGARVGRHDHTLVAEELQDRVLEHQRALGVERVRRVRTLGRDRHLQQLRVDVEHDVGVHGPEPHPAVHGHRGRDRRGEAADVVAVQSEVEQVHHPGHRDSRPDLHGDQQGLAATTPERATAGLLQPGDCGADLFAEAVGEAAAGLAERSARGGVDHGMRAPASAVRSSGPGPRPCHRTVRRRSGRCGLRRGPSAPWARQWSDSASRRGRPSRVRMSSWNSNQMLWIESAVGLVMNSLFPASTSSKACSNRSA